MKKAMKNQMVHLIKENWAFINTLNQKLTLLQEFKNKKLAIARYF